MRPKNLYNPGGKRPHAGRFEKLLQEIEADAERAHQREELARQCLMWIDPTPASDSCEVAAPGFEVTPGGLSYQDAALQWLMNGGQGTLEDVSEKAAKRADSEDSAHCVRRFCGDRALTLSVPAGWISRSRMGLPTTYRLEVDVPFEDIDEVADSLSARGLAPVYRSK